MSRSAQTAIGNHNQAASVKEAFYSAAFNEAGPNIDDQDKKILSENTIAWASARQGLLKVIDEVAAVTGKGSS